MRASYVNTSCEETNVTTALVKQGVDDAIGSGIQRNPAVDSGTFSRDVTLLRESTWYRK